MSGKIILLIMKIILLKMKTILLKMKTILRIVMLEKMNSYERLCKASAKANKLV